MITIEPTAEDLAEMSDYFASVQVEERRKLDRRHTAETLAFRLSLMNVAAFVAGVAFALVAIVK